MIGISSCLVGVCCRYDGAHSLHSDLQQMILDKKAIHFCPEVLGGLTTPREPAEIVGGTAADVWLGTALIQTISGIDVTEEFKIGALLALKQAQEQQIRLVILKENSPSCGSCFVYDGTFSGNKITGTGLTTALFLQHGIQVSNEKQYHEFL